MIFTFTDTQCTYISEYVTQFIGEALILFEFWYLPLYLNFNRALKLGQMYEIKMPG